MTRREKVEILLRIACGLRGHVTREAMEEAGVSPYFFSGPDESLIREAIEALAALLVPEEGA